MCTALVKKNFFKNSNDKGNVNKNEDENENENERMREGNDPMTE